MFRKILIFTLVLSLFALICGCGPKKTLHCDSCGKEAEVSEKSNMEEDWIILCKDCEEDMLKENPSLNEK